MIQEPGVDVDRQHRALRADAVARPGLHRTAPAATFKHLQPALILVRSSRRNVIGSCIRSMHRSRSSSSLADAAT
jgi:hypothetical protein